MLEKFSVHASIQVLIGRVYKLQRWQESATTPCRRP